MLVGKAEQRQVDEDRNDAERDGEDKPSDVNQTEVKETEVHSVPQALTMKHEATECVGRDANKTQN